ncbi:potassium/proton antiporter [Marinicauda algicola]|uniref:Potassium/proton antiporter n=1 Tax=Marinicauda algicola TaxID=2029849 RepID=A0A4S2H1P1_9PROT|nr:potassium/proton antiporter [Marinicauda algicola]TGY89191.1 potassium/proton antiporter [Marinicauda algicola]
MDNAELILLAAAGLVLLAVAGAAATSRAGAPLLLVFLSIGMLAGVEGPGGVDFHAHDQAWLFGSLALALILFDGGLGTRLRSLKLVLRPALSLATIGVVLTAGITAGAARVLFDLGWVEALLMGAIVSSTDAAAVLALIAGREMHARPRVATTLEAESGFNDPVAVILVTACVEVLAREGEPNLALLGVSVVWALAAGGLIGWFGGQAIALAERRVHLPESLYPIFSVTAGVFLFALAQSLEASGFLAAYLAGVSLGAVSEGAAKRATERFSDGLAWLAQIGLFLMLGLLVVPSHAVSVALPALILALVLIFIARPVAVLICLIPESFRANEKGFIAWMGLRGAVPIFLGSVPVIAGVGNANLYFSAAFAVVLASLVIQGWTAGPVTRLFRIAPPRAPRPRLQALRGFGIAAGGLAAAAAAMYIGAGLLEREETIVEPASLAELRQALARAEDGTGLRLATLPADWAELDAASRRDLFAPLVIALMEAENARILEDRAVIRRMIQWEAEGRSFSLPEQARRDTLARAYGGRYGDLEGLLVRADVIPPRLAAAQAALATGWGSSEAVLERNALFGRGGGPDGFATLSASVSGYGELLNTHPDFEAFRAERAALRAAGEAIAAEALVEEIAPYARGEDYVGQVRAVLAGLPQG